MRRRGFTLIELLVVIAIIAILASLLFVAIGWALRRSRLMVTQGRMQNAVTAVETAEVSGNRVLTIMARALDDPLQLVPFRSVAATLVQADNWPGASSYKFNAASDDIYRRVPPNTAYTYSNKGLVGEESSQGDKFIIMHMPWWLGPDDAEVMPDPALRAGERPYRMWYRNRWPMSWPKGNWRTWEPVPAWDPLLKPLYDPVKEAFADAETSSSSPYTSYLTDDKRFYHPQRWMHPWGKEPLHLVLGDWGYGKPSLLQKGLQAEQPSYRRWPHPLGPAGAAMSKGSYALADLLPEIEDGRSLADLDPLHTVALLQYAGVLPAGPDGINAYCSARGAAQAWNDRWGNPLVVAQAVWMAPRWDPVLDSKACNSFDVQYQKLIDQDGDGGLDESRFLLGPRDRILKQAVKKYGCSSTLYLSAGAPGAILRDEVFAAATATGAAVLTIPPKRLPQTLRALWLQVGEATQASTWGDAEMAAPPWKGMRSGTLPGGIESHILAPVEVR